MNKWLTIHMHIVYTPYIQTVCINLVPQWLDPRCFAWDWLAAWVGSSFGQWGIYCRSFVWWQFDLGRWWSNLFFWHSIFRQTIGVRCVLDPHMFFGMFFLPRDSEVMQTICSPLGPQCTKAIWSWCCFAWVHTGEGYGGYGCACCEIYSVTDFDDFQVQPWGDTIHTWWCWATCSGTDQKTEVGFVVDYQHQFSMFLFIFDAVDYFTFSSCLFNNLEYNEFSFDSWFGSRFWSSAAKKSR